MTMKMFRTALDLLTSAAGGAAIKFQSDFPSSLSCLLSTLQGWNSGPAQSQLHRGRQVCAALRAGLPVKIPPDSEHLFGLSAG